RTASPPRAGPWQGQANDARRRIPAGKRGRSRPGPAATGRRSSAAAPPEGHVRPVEVSCRCSSRLEHRLLTGLIDYVLRLGRFQVACVMLAALAQPAPARAEPPGGPPSGASGGVSDEAARVATTETAPKGARPSVDDICRTLAQAAADND